MNIITTKEQLDEFVQFYSQVNAFAFDVETIGENRLYPVINDVCWISFATDGRTDVIPMGHPNGELDGYDKPLLIDGQRRLAAGKEITEAHYSADKRKWVARFSPAPEQLTPRQVFDAIQPLMFGPQLKVAHNAKFDLKSIAKYYKGKVPTKPYFDTLTASFIVNNLASKFGGLSLKECVKRELGVEMEKGVGENVALHSFTEVANYSGIDSELTWKLFKVLQEKITDNLKKVWALEMDVLAVLCDMELTGAYIDTQMLDTLAEQIGNDKELAKAKAFKAAGEAFAINSVQEKQRLLFTSVNGNPPRLTPPAFVKGNVNKSVLTEKGVEAAKKGEEVLATHFSTSAEALEYHRGKDDLVDALLEYADLNKLMTTYVTPYKGGMVERETNGKKTLVEKKSLLINGRVHTNFKSHGAETGRFSSSEPNLQNIPSSGDYGKLVRNLFVAPPGHKLVVADYSQIEPRIIASFSGDPRLVDNYRNGGDIYTAIGETMGVDRKAGKVLVLAISYGVGPDKIASSIGCSLQQAKDLLKRFEGEFASITKYKNKVVRNAKTSGHIPFVETIFGRRRYIPELSLKAPEKNYNQLTEEDKVLRGAVARAERQAFNTVIQGSAADVMKLALVRAHSCFIDENDINVILTVHDELVTITPEDRAEETAEAIRQSMEGIKLKEITVPLIADVHIVDKWGEAK
jgi:DNA polymerase I-like protein with 3'-5' exonuclease and polymerase domains